MSYKTKVKEEKSVLASGFIPTEPEEINAQWLFEVINQYREVKNLSLLKKPDDILECEINERLNSRGYLSSTYIINCKFKVISFKTNLVVAISSKIISLHFIVHSRIYKCIDNKRTIFIQSMQK